MHPPVAASAVTVSLLLISVALAQSGPVVAGGSGPDGSTVAEAATVPSQAAGVMWPENGGTLRVGGDLFAIVEHEGETYRSGAALIDTPLPVGYPAPTPAGAIELKAYPTVRRAQVAGEQNPDLGQNSSFWPLFEHIKKHDIAMTSPVEMDYDGLERDDASPRESDWTMSFLYRTPDMNSAGTEGRVVVADLPPVTMLAVGYTGSYSVGKVSVEVEKLYLWLDAHPEYRAIGSPRAMFYNGPDTPAARRWAEVQLPVERTAMPSALAAPNTSGTPATVAP